MKKVQDEIRNSLRKGKVSESGIHQLQYLKMVVKETLRLHPAAPLLLPRKSIAHFNLADYEYNENKPQLPPGLPRLPIIGNLHQLGPPPHQSLWQLSKRYCHVILLHFGTVPGIVVSSAEAAKEVLKINDLACCSRPPLTDSGKLSYNNLDISFSPYGVHWREIRKICVLKLFSMKSVQTFDFIRAEEIDSLIDSLNELSLSSTPVNLSEKMSTLMASMTFWTAFRKRFAECGLDNDIFEDMIHRVMAGLGSFHDLDNFFRLVIDEHLNRTPQEGNEDIVDLLLRVERTESESGEVQFTRDCTKAILMCEEGVVLYRSIREEEGTKLIISISKHSSSGTPADLTEKLFAVTARQLSSGLILLMKKIPNMDLAAEATIGSFYAIEHFPYIRILVNEDARLLLGEDPQVLHQ
ncbi:Cytochrome P, partial [Parasponia andersonii]